MRQTQWGYCRFTACIFTQLPKSWTDAGLQNGLSRYMHPEVQLHSLTRCGTLAGLGKACSPLIARVNHKENVVKWKYMLHMFVVMVYSISLCLAQWKSFGDLNDLRLWQLRSAISIFHCLMRRVRFLLLILVIADVIRRIPICLIIAPFP